jgi:hypothetical protein
MGALEACSGKASTAAIMRKARMRMCATQAVCGSLCRGVGITKIRRKRKSQTQQGRRPVDVGLSRRAVGFGCSRCAPACGLPFGLLAESSDALRPAREACPNYTASWGAGKVWLRFRRRVSEARPSPQPERRSAYQRDNQRVFLRRICLRQDRHREIRRWSAVLGWRHSAVARGRATLSRRRSARRLHGGPMRARVDHHTLRAENTPSRQNSSDGDRSRANLNMGQSGPLSRLVLP